MRGPSYIRSICFLLLLSTSLLSSAEQLMVVVHKDAEIDRLSKKQIKRIFMEPYSPSHLKPVNLPKGSKTRVIFNTKVIGLPESRISSYWAQMKFSGRGKPPMELDSETDVLDLIQNSKKHVGYLLINSDLPAGVKPLFTIQY